MLKKDIIKLLDRKGISYMEQNVNGVEFVYAYGKSVFVGQGRERHEYIPYIRMSHFEERRTYVRDNGWCEFYNNEKLTNKIEGLVN